MVPNDWMHPAITKRRRQPSNGVLLSAWNSLPPALHESSLPLNTFQRKLETPLHATTTVIQRCLIKAPESAKYH